MKIVLSFIAVIVLVLLAYAGANAGLQPLFGIYIPYLAAFIFIVFFIRKIIKWAGVPVPFCIPTTCGQQKSLPWIKQNKVENPSGKFGVFIRMALEILVFRSLFRNLKTEIRGGGDKVVYGSAKWLWMAGLAFHWSFLIIFIRHFRLFLPKLPLPIQIIERLDSFLQIGAPLLYMTDVVILGAVTYLVLRRLFIPQVRYISLTADYFPLFLILGIATTGVLMRYYAKVDIIKVKELTMGLVSFSPAIPEGGIGSLFYVHLFLVSSLLMYFPFSKLMHMGGVFMSPTRNMANDSRMVRHINPWNYPVKLHTYDEYEDDFREKMKAAGIPVEKE